MKENKCAGNTTGIYLYQVEMKRKESKKAVDEGNIRNLLKLRQHVDKKRYIHKVYLSAM